ncbi:DUF448 domain-containing protein [Helicobacter sp. 23-1046]
MAKQVRMCVVCKARFHQSELCRLQVKKDAQNQSIIGFFSGAGRSFYVCESCKGAPKTLKSIMKRFKAINEDFSFER